MSSILGIVNAAKPKPATVPITSLMDALTIILVFLLANYSDEESKHSPVRAIALPTVAGMVETVADQAILVAVDQDVIVVDKKEIRLIKGAAGRTQVLDRVAAELKSAAAAIKTKDGKPPKIMVQADKDLSFEAIEGVLFAASSVGLTQFQLVGKKDMGK